MIKSWSLAATMIVLSKVMKKLPHPWLAVADIGVVAGLSFGAVSIVIKTIQALFGNLPQVDECLPEKKAD
jgi:hypothetical protein